MEVFNCIASVDSLNFSSDFQFPQSFFEVLVLIDKFFLFIN